MPIDIREITAGAYFWECESGMNALYYAITPAIERNGYVYLYARRVKTQGIVYYLWYSKQPAYWLRFYTTPQYSVRGTDLDNG